MIYCEQCRINKKLKRPATYPYHDHGAANCEICGRYRDCYDYLGLYVRDRETWGLEEKILDKRIQEEYRNKAEQQLIAFCTGSLAGAVDHDQTEALQKAIVKINGEVDWYATVKIRERLQDGYRRAKQKRR